MPLKCLYTSVAAFISRKVRTLLKLKQFRRVRTFLDMKAATLVYKNMMLPIIEYGDIFLTGATKENRKKLQILQNRGLRCALNADRYTGTGELHSEAKLMRLKFRREQHLLNFMFDQAQISGNLKRVRTEGVRTRSSKLKLLKVKKPNTEKFKRSLTYRGPKKWNALPSDIQLTESRTCFKTKIRSHIEAKSKAHEELSLVHHSF